MAVGLGAPGDCLEGTAKKLFIRIDFDFQSSENRGVIFFTATTDTLASSRNARGVIPVEASMTASSINRDAVAEAKRILVEQCGVIFTPKLKVIMVGGATTLK
jgi:hypothetical protein